MRKIKLVFLFLSVLSVLAVHIPVLPLTVQALGHGFTNLVGQEHRWTMFSADPRGDSLDLWAQLELEGGRILEWKIDRDRTGGDLSFYHWVKWMETAVLEPSKAHLPEFADWLALSSSLPVREIVIFGERREGPPVGEPPAPSVVVELGRYLPRSR
ncbi:MAG TPA: hypothetical protein VJ935_13040 [Acidimicrobiia bacterium]|nr:hypothetical protein [Acidimicrobiia bacterium]